MRDRARKCPQDCTPRRAFRGVFYLIKYHPGSPTVTAVLNRRFRLVMKMIVLVAIGGFVRSGGSARAADVSGSLILP